MTDEERADLRAFALDVQQAHDPHTQAHGYDRCEHCHFVRHPCDAYDMADAVLRLLDDTEAQA